MEAAAMKVLVNGRTCDVDLPDDAGFEEVVKSVTQAVTGPGRAITRIRLNGEDITGKDWGAYLALTTAQIDRLEIETSDVAELARETLESVVEFIDNLLTVLQRTAERFRLGDERAGGDAFTHAIDGIQIVNHTMVMIQRNLNISESSSDNGDSVQGHFTNLEPIITDILTAQGDQDWVLLADLIEYELIPHFQDRRKAIVSWRGAAGA